MLLTPSNKIDVTNLGRLGQVWRLCAIWKKKRWKSVESLEIFKNLRPPQERKRQDLRCTEFRIPRRYRYPHFSVQTVPVPVPVPVTVQTSLIEMAAIISIPDIADFHLWALLSWMELKLNKKTFEAKLKDSLRTKGHKVLIPLCLKSKTYNTICIGKNVFTVKVGVLCNVHLKLHQCCIVTTSCLAGPEYRRR